MTTVAIVAIPATNGELSYYAAYGDAYTFGQTAGEVLDAITPKLDTHTASTLVVIQYHRPDEYFDATQQARLIQLMERWRTARDAAHSLPSTEQAELEALVEAELLASAARTQAIANNIAS